MVLLVIVVPDGLYYYLADYCKSYTHLIPAAYNLLLMIIQNSLNKFNLRRGNDADCLKVG